MPALAGGYDHVPERQTIPLPNVLCQILTESVEPRPPAGVDALLPDIDQLERWEIYGARLLLAVEPEPVDEAAEALATYVAQLRTALDADRTLGGRVGGASPFFQASYDPPFAELDDGLRVRVATFQLTVAEAIPE